MGYVPVTGETFKYVKFSNTRHHKMRQTTKIPVELFYKLLVHHNFDNHDLNDCSQLVNIRT
ncbi:hypothetical protein YC2023_063789 [Brassica napus]